MRAVSTLMWLLAFLVLYSGYYFLHSAVTYLTENLLQLSLLPFIGLFLISVNLKVSVISAPITAALLVLSVKLALSKVKLLLRLTSYQPSIAASQHAPSVTAISQRGFVAGCILKDLRVLLREPRRLANILIFFILPVLIFGYQILARQPASGSKGFAALAIGIGIVALIGAFGGSSVENLFFMEREQAKALYLMPISRKELVLTKSLALTLISIAVSPVAAILIYYISYDLILTIAAAILAVLACFSFALLDASIIVGGLPRTTSAWSEASLSKGRLFFLRLMVMFLAIAFSMGIPFILALLRVPYYPYVSVAVLSLTSLAIAGAAYLGFVREEPL